MQHSTWHELVKKELPEHYFDEINQFMDYVYQQELIYPPCEKVFNTIQTVPPEDVKVVIVGRDPCHGPSQAQGLSFSVPGNTPAPPSLQNILKELSGNLGQCNHHDLTPWAQQGVLLLNACLTVPAGRANSHAGQIQKSFTDAITKVVNQKETPVVFILWGGYARKKKALITNPIHHVIESAHPNSLSAYRGFSGSHPFSRANAYLTQDGLEAIDWLK